MPADLATDTTRVVTQFEIEPLPTFAELIVLLGANAFLAQTSRAIPRSGKKPSVSNVLDVDIKFTSI